MGNRKSKVGRPTKFTVALVKKLEHAFSIGATNKEACIYAGISQASLYKYLDEHEEFKRRADLLRQTPVLRARTKVVESLDEDVKSAQWYLERKAADEFAPISQQKHVHEIRDDQGVLDKLLKLQRLAGKDDSDDGDIIEAEIVPQLAE